jgi:hypothetical protein
MFLVIFCFGRRPIFILSKKFPVELIFQFSKCFYKWSQHYIQDEYLKYQISKLAGNVQPDYFTTSFASLHPILTASSMLFYK